MRDWLRTLIAGYGAYRWGGGCLGTIVVFMLIYWALGSLLSVKSLRQSVYQELRKLLTLFSTEKDF